MRKVCGGAVAAALSLAPALPSPASAADNSATLNVTATVVASGCSLTGGTMDFGTYVSGQTQSKQTTAGLTVNCPSNVELTFDFGLSPVGSGRAMTSGSNLLKYDLFINGPDRVQAGDGRVGTARSVTGSASPQRVDVYGTIVAGQKVAPGRYTDTVTIQMTVK